MSADGMSWFPISVPSCEATHRNITYYNGKLYIFDKKYLDVDDEAALTFNLASITSEIKSWAGYVPTQNVDDQ